MTSDLAPESLGDHADRLYRAAWSLCGAREDAEDLVQETFARVLSRRRHLAGEDPLPYLLQVLRNTFVASLRARERRPRTVPIDERLAAPAASSPDRALAAREVVAAIAALPGEQGAVVAAVDLGGLSYAEASRRLGIPIGTVMSRLHRGRGRVVAAVA